jgi:phosphoenolpyruvate synthase/pyruvate phosphate dikinase
MSEFWQILIATLGGSAVLLLAVGFLVKTLVSHLLSKDVERFKAEVQHNATLQLERALSGIRQAALEREVRFRQLHEKRSLVVAELYSRLVSAVDKLEYSFQPMEWVDQPSRDEKLKEAVPCLIELRGYFERNRILFPGELANQVHAFIEKLGDWLHEYQTCKFIGDHGSADRTVTAGKDAAVKAAWKGLHDEVPGLRAALEVEFRRLLEV